MGATTDFFMPMVDMSVPVFILGKPREDNNLGSL
jgi:hypothetical protein